MRYCEFAEEVAKRTGVSPEICSQIWVQTLERLKKDFQELEPPCRSNPIKIYEYFKDKHIGLRFGPFRLCANTYKLMRKTSVFKFNKERHDRYKESRANQAKG